MITKITYNHKINPWSGLTRDQGYRLEKNCLLLLEKNFKCICGLESAHFPIIKNCIDEEYKFILSDCGCSLDKYKKNIKTNEMEPYKINNRSAQINCIIANLRRCKIKHLDMKGIGNS